ncbi:MAG: hypothetical protein ABSH32_06225 [Bryobacteraceae bacterium]|jgi:hypothetical protein
MREHDLQGLLAAAQSRVRGARALLARPRACNLDECVTLFREAQGYLEWLRDRLPQAGPASRDLRPHATTLAGEIRQAGVLIEQAARYGRRWLERLRSISPEYTASGSAVPLQIRGHISFLG